MSLFRELKRRNVFRVGIAYVVGSWLLIQVADILLEAFEAPAWTLRFIIVLLGIGFPVAMFFAIDRQMGLGQWSDLGMFIQSLMLVRPRDAKSFMLAQVRWLMAAQNGDLLAGVRLLPGVPTAVAVRPTGLNAQNEKYQPALVLGAVPALEAPASLVLSPGWFKPKRVIEACAEAEDASRLRLTEVLERGSDFERVAYEPAA